MRTRFFTPGLLRYLIVFPTFIGFFALAQVVTVTAQKKPVVVANAFDAKALCTATPRPAETTEFCVHYNDYSAAVTAQDFEKARFFRDEMAKDVILKVNTFYEENKNKRKKNRALLQTIFDVLEIGASVAISITNGERAKTVISEALNGFQAGRNTLNDNFDLLKTKILINKMRENRALILTRIRVGLNSGVDTYSWTDAKIDLQDYFFAGTFSNALDSLVGDTGDDASNAEDKLRMVERQPIAAPATKTQEDNSKAASDIRVRYIAALTGSDEPKKAAVTKKLIAIVEEMRNNEELLPLLEDQGISSKTDDGMAIFTALNKIISKQSKEGRAGRAKVDSVNLAIINVDKTQ